ncbi:MAG: carboxypeptidase-like regulatory domain-containing protein [Planctomycetota bacterium]|jgi:hypothetical protein
MQRPWIVLGGAAVGLAVLLAFFAGGPGGGGDGTPYDRDGDPASGDPALSLRDTSAGGTGRDPNLTGRPVEPPPPFVAPRGEVEVEVFGAGGIPLTGQWISVFENGERREFRSTGRDGRLVLEALPYDGSVSLALGRHQRSPTAIAKVTGPKVVLTAPDVLDLTITLVDAETGAEVPNAHWSLPASPGMPPPTLVRSGEGVHVRHTPGASQTIAFTATAPRGYVAWDASAWTTTISPFASRLEAVHPLRREADITITVTEPEGHAAAGAHVKWCTVAGKTIESPQIGVFLLGGFPLPGIPYFREEKFRIAVGTPTGNLGWGDFRLPAQVYDPARFEITVAPPEAAREPEDDEPADHVETDNDLASGLGLAEVPSAAGIAPEMLGELVVEAQRAGGLPAIGVRVLLPVPGVHRTDRDGRVSVEGVPPGAYRVVLAAPGLVPTAEEAVVVAGETARIVLVEAPGGTLHVTVKDGRGRPLPFPVVSFQGTSGIPWIDLAEEADEGAWHQRLDPYGDESGVRVFHRVESGPVHVRARWAGRGGTAEAVVRERQVTEVTVVIE